MKVKPPVSWCAAVLVGVLSLGMTPWSSAAWAPEDGDEAFTLGDGWPEGTPGWQGVTFDSNGLAYLWPSRMVAFDASGRESPCTRIDEEPCSSSTAVLFYALLPTCQDAASTWCVSGVRAVTQTGDRVDGVPLQSYPESGPGGFPPEPRVNLPRGAMPTLWEIPGVDHGGGVTTYLSVVGVQGYFHRSTATKPWRPLEIDSLQSYLYPVKIQSGDYKAPILDEGGWGLMNWNFGPECAAATNGSCAKRYAFPTDTRFGMSIRLGTSPGSFFHGRLVEPALAIEDGSSGPAIDIEALPTQVPVVATWQKWADLPDYVQQLYPLDWHGPYIDFGERSWRDDVTTRVMMSTPTAGGTRSMNELIRWLKFLGDKSSADPVLWSFSTVPTQELAGVNSCFTKGNRVNGLVTTNATSYSSGPPAFDAVSQTLNYKVAAPHFTRTGDVFSGSYSLALRSDVARCIYGFSKAPIKAMIQVLDAGGETSVATTSVAESKGWLTLTALNFHYSQPTIQVKLTGKKKRK